MQVIAPSVSPTASLPALTDTDFAHFLAELGPFEDAPTIAVALSGGADSMALTLMTHQWVQRCGGKIIALTIDHGLRSESPAESQQVGAWMRERGIEHHILKPPHIEAGNNVMQAARQWRYDALAEFCSTQHILHCLIAHHADDQLETALLQRTRGETSDGGSGMPSIRIYRGVRFLRPLLSLNKSQLEHYLHARGVDWIEDPSNGNAQFARVRARKKLQQQDDLRKAIAENLMEAQRERAQREQLLAHAAAQYATIHPNGSAEIELDAWRALEPVLGNQLLADSLRCISGATNRARGHEIARLGDRLRKRDKGKCCLQHCEITLQKNTIRIAREPAGVASPVTLQGTGELYWDRRFHVRYRLPEDASLTLRALGQNGMHWLRTTQPMLYKTLKSQIFPAMPSLWHLDVPVSLPHIAELGFLNLTHHVHIGFAPAKPLAATPFW